MAVQTVENIQRLPPYLEGLQKRLLQTGFGVFDGDTQTTPGLLDSALNLPGFQIAGTDPLQTKATQLGEQMVGSFQLRLLASAYLVENKQIMDIIRSLLSAIVNILVKILAQQIGHLTFLMTTTHLVGGLK